MTKLEVGQIRKVGDLVYKILGVGEYKFFVRILQGITPEEERSFRIQGSEDDEILECWPPKPKVKRSQAIVKTGSGKPFLTNLLFTDTTDIINTYGHGTVIIQFPAGLTIETDE